MNYEKNWFNKSIGIERFQLIQQDDDRLQLRLIADHKQDIFNIAKKEGEHYLFQNGVDTDVYLSEKIQR